MLEVTLTVRSRLGARSVLLTEPRLTIGRGDAAMLSIDDPGLSRVHASINSDVGKVWILDEGSINGSFVNGEAVPSTGRPLADGDEITIGNDTIILVSVIQTGEAGAVNKRKALLGTPMVSVSLIIVGLLVVALIGSQLFSGFAGDLGAGMKNTEAEIRSVPDSVKTGADSEALPDGSQPSSDTGQPPDLPPIPPEQARRRSYREMTDLERIDFIDKESQKITMRISNSTRPEVFDQFVLRAIKRWVDSYAASRGNTGLWGVSSGVILKRAIQYAPYISRCFNQEDMPPIIGLYIVWIETAYVNVAFENKAHAMGLFQFIPDTARAYGVDPSQRTNVEKMAPAAARYLKQRIARFGGDAKGVALAIANYNRGGTPEDLRKTIDKDSSDRSFWTLMANKEKLNHYFQNENVDYVPRFFAGAIVGENPHVFNVDMNPLSSYH